MYALQVYLSAVTMWSKYLYNLRKFIAIFIRNFNAVTLIPCAAYTMQWVEPIELFCNVYPEHP